MLHAGESGVLLLVAAILFSTGVCAQVRPEAKTCNACTVAQVEALLPDCAVRYQYVVDFEYDRLYWGCYNIEGAQSGAVPPPAGTTNAAAWRQVRQYVFRPPPADAQKLFHDYQSLYVLSGHKMHINIVVHADIPMKAASAPASATSAQVH